MLENVSIGFDHYASDISKLNSNIGHYTNAVHLDRRLYNRGMKSITSICVSIEIMAEGIIACSDQ